MAVTMDLIKELRARTGAGIMDAKTILSETDGDLERAIAEMRKRGQKIAAKKSDRATGAGVIDCYVHGTGNIAAIVEVQCETDFVSRNEGFRAFAHDIAMHVAAIAPSYLAKADVPEDVLNNEREVVMAQLNNEGKPENLVAQIAEGKLQKFYSEVCLMQQAFFKDDKKTVQDILNEAIANFGENIVIRRFDRWVLGQ